MNKYAMGQQFYQMSNGHSRSLSQDLKQQLLGRRKMDEDGINKRRSMSLEKNLEESKLPLIKIRKVMKKIGAADKLSSSFSPSQQDIGAFRKSKWQELREQYIVRGGTKQPFDYELDEIVLDCWEYGENFGRRTIWRKYKQKFDELTFETLRAVNRKKV